MPLINQLMSLISGQIQLINKEAPLIATSVIIYEKVQLISRQNRKHTRNLPLFPPPAMRYHGQSIHKHPWGHRWITRGSVAIYGYLMVSSTFNKSSMEILGLFAFSTFVWNLLLINGMFRSISRINRLIDCIDRLLLLFPLKLIALFLMQLIG